MQVRFVYVGRYSVTMADIRYDLVTLTLLFMVRNIKCGYSFSLARMSGAL